MSTPNPKVDAFVERASAWQAEIRALRTILLDCGLDEELKWGKPCYTLEGRNVAIVQPFQAHCALLFFKGALLTDARGLLRSQGEHTRAALRLEFTGVAQIKPAVVRDYVTQAVAIERAGLKVERGAGHEPEPPEEWVRILARDRRLQAAFEALTPGRRRAYLLHFTGAKQAKTRIARIEKWIPRILAGKGMDDR